MSGWFRRVLAVAVGAMTLFAGGVAAHGMLVEPRARNVVHNSNYCPHCLAAGGPGTTYAGGRVWPNSVHGACGDPAAGPLDHEAGGKFATKVVTGTYVRGQRLTLRVKISAPHGGRFSFGICPVPDGATDAVERQKVTQACFDANRLTNAVDNTPYWWFGKRGVGEYTMDFVLPPAISCKRCVLQWHYETGNSCTIPGTPEQHAMSPNMVSCDKTGVMEEFWNCADVSVTDDGKKPQPTKTAKKTTAKKKATVKRREAYTNQYAGGGGDGITTVTALSLAVIALALPSILATSAAAGIVLWFIMFRYLRPHVRPRRQWYLAAPPPTKKTLWNDSSSTRTPCLVRRLS